MHGIETIHQIHRKHAQMLVEELYIAVVDSLRDLLTDLMRRPPLDHIETGPSVLSLCAGGGPDEEIEF